MTLPRLLRLTRCLAVVLIVAFACVQGVAQAGVSELSPSADDTSQPAAKSGGHVSVKKSSNLLDFDPYAMPEAESSSESEECDACESVGALLALRFGVEGSRATAREASFGWTRPIGSMALQLALPFARGPPVA